MATNPLHASDSKEHYTPPAIIRPVRQVLGQIDLDPASSSLANSIVGARRIFTAQDDGLSQPWSDRVFVNPPGGTVRVRGKTTSVQSLWWSKVVREWLAHRVESAVFVGFNLEILRHSQLAERSMFDFPFCVLLERICFLKNQAGILVPQTQPTHANVIAYLPSTDSCMECECFGEAFSPFGHVAMPNFDRWRPEKSAATSTTIGSTP